MVAVIALALMVGTRWCILMFYTKTYVPTDARSVQEPAHLISPPKTSPREEESPSSTLAPQYQAVQTARGR